MLEGNQPTTYDTLMVRAQAALAGLDLPEALAAFEAAQAAVPGSYDVQIGLARTLSRMRREKDALAAAQQAVQLGHGRPEAHAVLGALHFMADRYAESTKELQQALAVAPGDPEARMTLVQVYTDTKEYARADSELLAAKEQIAQLADVHKRDELYALACHTETYLRLAEGKEKEAIACAEEALAFREANPYAACLAYSNLGIIAARARRYDDAIEYLERAFQMNPFMSRVGGALGRLLLTRNQVGRAAEVLGRTLEMNPEATFPAQAGAGATRYVYALALAKSGQRTQARIQYQQALQAGLPLAEGLLARWQLLWLSQTGRYVVIGLVLAVVLAWLLVARPSTQVMTLVLLLAVILVLQRLVGGRRRK